jgi:hypothetical protein
MWLFFSPLFYKRSPVIHCNFYLDLRQDTKDFRCIRKELVVQMALTFLNYILQQGLFQFEKTGLITSKQ